LQTPMVMEIGGGAGCKPYGVSPSQRCNHGLMVGYNDTDTDIYVYRWSHLGGISRRRN